MIDKVIAWQEARRALLVALADQDAWLRTTKQGREVAQPNPLLPLWAALASAEADLFAAVLPEGWREAAENVQGHVADLAGEHDVMAGRPADLNEWTIEIKAAHLRTLATVCGYPVRHP